MFWHNFKYQLKILLRDRALVFWTLAFPLILGTFFYLAFSNIESSEKFTPPAVAVVDDAAFAEQETFRAAFAELSNPDSPDQLFTTSYVSEETAAALLEDDEIVAYLRFVDDRPEIVASTGDVYVTILQLAVGRISEQITITNKIAAKDPRQLAALATAETAELRDVSSDHLSYSMIEYYTLIAMACLYGGMISLVAVNHLLGNMSASGKRIAISPAPKAMLLVSALLASYLIQLVGLVLLFAYTSLVLGVDYGEYFPQIVLLSLVGCLGGLALGVAVASLFRINENAKTGLILSLSMFGCFLAGMMGITMKYLVDTHLPLANRLNPANLITDGLYALYYYGPADRFWGNVATLGIITLVIISVSTLALRKEQYDSL